MKKIVFKTPKDITSFNKDMTVYNAIEIENNVQQIPYKEDRSIRSIENGPNTNFQMTGQFEFFNNKINLNKGDFQVSFTSFQGKSGYVGVRCFVKPMHFPDAKEKIENFNKQVIENEQIRNKLNSDLFELNKDINENSAHLECAKKGLYDEKKGEHLVKLLYDLEYTFDGFIEVLMSEIKEESAETKKDLEWLEKKENLDQIKHVFVNYEKINNHLPKDVDLAQIPKKFLDGFIFGKKEDNEKEEEIKVLKQQKTNIKNFDFYRLLRLYKIASKSGLSFPVLQNLVNSLKSPNKHGLKRSLKEQKEELKNIENTIQSKKDLFEEKKWIIDVLHIVVEVLNFNGVDEYIEFEKIKALYDSKNASKFQDTNVNNLEENVTQIENQIEPTQEITEIIKTNTETKKQKPAYRILSIDGGGVRGVIPAIILNYLEKKCNKPINKLFNMISGTSTGAIIAVMLSIPKDSTDSDPKPKYTAEQCVDFYKNESSRIFESRNVVQYDNNNLKEILLKNLNGGYLSSALVDLVIPAVNENELHQTHIFESRIARLSQKDNWDFYNVLMATTAAPTYFKPHKIEGLGCFIDGGLRANNPALMAYTRYREYLESEDEDTKKNVFVLSIGTGRFVSIETGAECDNSLLFWAQNAARYAIIGHAADTDRHMKSLLCDDRYVRLQVDLRKPVSLDDHTKLNDLESLTLDCIAEWERNGTFDKIISKLID